MRGWTGWLFKLMVLLQENIFFCIFPSYLKTPYCPPHFLLFESSASCYRSCFLNLSEDVLVKLVMATHNLKKGAPSLPFMVLPIYCWGHPSFRPPCSPWLHHSQLLNAISSISIHQAGGQRLSGSKRAPVTTYGHCSSLISEGGSQVAVEQWCLIVGGGRLRRGGHTH